MAKKPAPPPPRMPNRYRLYIDESGDHAYKKLDSIGHRYLALLGVWFKQPDAYTAFSDSLDKLKREIFGPRPDNPVILHRSDIINRKREFGVLCDEDKRRHFDDTLIAAVSEAEFRMTCVVIDKQNHQDRYSSPFHPYHYCLAAMLDRYSGYLNYCASIGDAMAEARGKEEDIQLGQAYKRVYESGTLMFGRHHHQRALTSSKLKIKPKSADIAGLQLADILAHPIKQHCLLEAGLIDGSLAEFGDRILVAAMPKFNKRFDTGRIDGYGRVIL